MARDVSSTFNAWMFSLNSETQEVFLNTGNELPQNGLELTLPRFIFAGYKKFNLGKKGIYGAAEIDIDITTDGARNTIFQKPNQEGNSTFLAADPHLGIEFGFKTFLAVRGGISNVQYVKQTDDSQKLNIQPNIGIGLNIKNFSLDYAFTDIGDASVSLYSHVISLRIKLNPPNQ
jgi:hypothetical protein